MPPAKCQPLPRCCSSHSSFEILLSHLVQDFCEVDEQEVSRRAEGAARAVRAFGADPGIELETVEIICRYQLSVAAGRIEDAARLDPQTHPRRRKDARVAEVPVPAQPVTEPSVG